MAERLCAKASNQKIVGSSLTPGRTSGFGVRAEFGGSVRESEDIEGRSRHAGDRGREGPVGARVKKSLAAIAAGAASATAVEGHVL